MMLEALKGVEVRKEMCSVVLTVESWMKWNYGL